MGWVAKKRDFGILTFVDLRDRDGITQIVLNEEDAGDAHSKAKNLRGEFVVAGRERFHEGLRLAGMNPGGTISSATP